MIRNRTFLKDVEIGFAEMNSVGIIRGILYIQACKPFLVVPPNVIIYHDMGSLI